ncbi:hypothetical protein B9479_002752 [Cryptococcus floricola]|uniref:Uncharacterized protein n=1 Tax=Cryptococcus floricola TaxID=2591691 RepID=A0A5D3AYT7_9TREE|nr:hypothetical protein B9479_002752 [Cryptococcus floricola]
MHQNARLRSTSPGRGDSSTPSTSPPPPSSYKTIFSRPPDTGIIRDRYHYTLTVPLFSKKKLGRSAARKRYKDWTAKMWIKASQLDHFGVPTRLVVDCFLEGDQRTLAGDLNVIVEPFGGKVIPNPDTWPSTMFDMEDFLRFPRDIDGDQRKEGEWIRQYMEKVHKRDVGGRRIMWLGIKRVQHGITVGKKHRSQAEINENKWNEAVSLTPIPQKRSLPSSPSDVSRQPHTKKPKSDRPFLLSAHPRPLIQITIPSSAATTAGQNRLPVQRAPNPVFSSSPSLSPSSSKPPKRQGARSEMADAFLASFEKELLQTECRADSITSPSLRMTRVDEEVHEDFAARSPHNAKRERHVNVLAPAASSHRATDAHKLPSCYVPRETPECSGANRPGDSGGMPQVASKVPLDTSSILALLVRFQANEVSFASSSCELPGWLQDLQKCSAEKMQQRQKWVEMIEDLPDLRPVMEKQLQRVEKDLEELIGDAIRLAGPSC